MTKETRKKELANHLLVNIRSAFDLNSGGMGIHWHAVSLLHKEQQPLPDWAKDSIGFDYSNYFKTSYVDAWFDPKSKLTPRPRYFSPHSDEHRRLLLRMYEEYTALGWKVLRATF